MTETSTPTVPSRAVDAVSDTLDQVADGFARQVRSPVLHWPDEAGLAYENVTFPALDGVPLEGWFIPCEGSRRLIIANHPMGFSRSGLPADVEPWRSMWSSSGNDVEVNFLPDYRILHDAGYAVLAYDLRNLGLSGAANGGIASSGIFEARDVAGALRFVAGDGRLSGLQIALFSRCLGCNSTLSAFHRHPEWMTSVRVLVGAQPVTTEVIAGHQLRLAGVPDGHVGDLDRRARLRTGISLGDRCPSVWAEDVHVPTMLYQVRDDVLTEPADVQNIYDRLGTEQKALHWIDGTTRRWDGYLEFQRRPQPMLDWFDRHLGPHVG